MKGLSESTAHPFDVVLRKEVAGLLRSVPDRWNGLPITSHELARAVGQVFNLRVVDGVLVVGDRGLPHSWCRTPVRAEGRPWWILDVCTPGRLPSVQLLDPSDVRVADAGGGGLYRSVHVVGESEVGSTVHPVDPACVDWLVERIQSVSGYVQGNREEEELPPLPVLVEVTPEEAERASRRSVGRRLRWLRQEAGHTLGDLARFLGCSVTEVSALEMDRYPHDPVREARERRVAELSDAILHPNGRCTCHGEGTCETWCRKSCRGCGQSLGVHEEDPGFCGAGT